MSEPTVRDAAERAVAVIGEGVRSGRDRLWDADLATTLGVLGVLRTRNLAPDLCATPLAEAARDAAIGLSEPALLVAFRDPLGRSQLCEVWGDLQAAQAAARQYADARVIALAPLADAVRSRLSKARNGGSVIPGPTIVRRVTTTGREVVDA